MSNLYDFLNQKSSNSPFKSNLSERGGYITFSNSGQRGSVKYFSLGLDSLIITLNDILENLNHFRPYQYYVEANWRDLGSQFYSDEPSNAMATVQTKPLFSTLSKLIVWANSPTLDNTDTDQNIVLEDTYIKNTINKLNELAEEFKPKITIKKNEVIIKKEKLKWIIFKTFKFLLEKYNENTLLENHKIKESKINETIYEGLSLPFYFGSDNLIGIFKEEQSKDELKSSNTERYFEENIKIFGYDFTYFSTQWSDTNGKGKTLVSFNKYLSDKSNNTLEIIKDGNLYNLISKAHDNNSSPLKKAEQIIFYGSPGTGKSHRADIETNGKEVQKVTFHPDYDYHSFVGGYKPTMDGDKIAYKFVPQIFTKIYVDAWKNLASTEETKPFYLQIEEINRGNCAEIFGDLFQLLDRDKDGFSKYEVTAEEELCKYLLSTDGFGGEHPGIENGKLRFPNNLNIIATMNTSDQSLFPMDSAFKRRWDWIYVPIDTDCKFSDFTIQLDNGKAFEWLSFLKIINEEIFEITKSQDKQIGNWFIDAQNSVKVISESTFVNKVIFYLWNDVFKDEENTIFKSPEGKNLTYTSFFENGTSNNLVSYILEERLKLTDLNKALPTTTGEE